MTAAERLAERLAAAARPHVPRGERQGPSASREIACRSCGRWTVFGEAGPWRHVHDGTLACVDPETLRPQVCARHGGELDEDGCWECSVEAETAEADRSEYEGIEP